MYAHRPDVQDDATARASNSASDPGKQSLVAPLVMQAAPSLIQAGADLTGGGPADPAATAQLASAGVAGASGRLPHHDAIQASFGHHDISGISVARDGGAAHASAQLGARAYAIGDRVALPNADLWTEAHEAAHVVQQRAGRVAAHGTAGDAHERHADAVADRVVAGQSATALLDEVAPGGGGGGAAGEHLQLFTSAHGTIAAQWGYAVAVPVPDVAITDTKQRADAAFEALKTALQQYALGATIPRIEAVLACGKTFAEAFNGMSDLEKGATKGRVQAQAKKLIDEGHAELHASLRTAATTPVIGQTPDQLVDAAANQVGDVEHRRDQKRVMRHAQKLGMKATELAEVTDAHGPAIIQSWRARGDMYHVGAVLNLFPQVKVILYDLPAPGDVTNAATFERERERGDRWEQACMIADYYGQPDRVFYTRSDGVAAKASKGHAYDFQHRAAANEAEDAMRGLFIDVGGCTTILGLDLGAAQARGTEAYATRKTQLAAAVAPSPRDADGRASADEIRHYLAANGWTEGTKYVLLNFRDSGHAHIQKKIRAAPQDQRASVIENYDPIKDQVGGNHPDLDTGVLGVQQLATLVRDRGFTPVFMGEEPANAVAPHLIKYWMFQHEYGEAHATQKLCRGGRAAEAYFIRVLAETYDVRLLSMRSGVTDQLAFLNIPTISIDVDNFHQASVPELSDTPGYQMGDDETAHSWARGTKLEAGLGRDYGRVFLSESRALNDFDAQGKWKGGFTEADQATIGSSLDFYFGSNDEYAPATNGVRHASHPFHPTKMAATKQNGDAAALNKAASGKIDTGLNPETVLAHMRAVLAGDAPNFAEATRFADSQLDFIEKGNTPSAPRDAAHRSTKLDQRITFLRSAIALLTDHGDCTKYTVELTALTQRAATNTRALIPLKQGLPALRAAIRFPMIDRNDRRVRDFLRPVDAVDLSEIDREITEANAVLNAERSDTFALRIASITPKLRTALQTISTAIAQGVAHHTGGTPYYSRAFTEARDKLAEIHV